jgi:asparagine synthase (glutamine-hydrolysing)
MCGISGIISQKPIDPAHIKAITDALIHRGPDTQGVYINETRTTALGHTRLSIIDLRPESNQPFVSNNKRYIIVFNGEIYNFKKIREELIANHNCTFRTLSDTEVIVEAYSVWGESMVNRMQGMFAIALLDRQTNKVYFFRDRAGKKPLFYFQSETLFVFASEIKSLLHHPVVKKEVKINYQIISSFLHLGYIPEPYTIYSNVFKFPSGHTGEVLADFALKIKPYWKIQDKITPQKITSVDSAKSKLTDLLDDAVQSRLISDVPLGAFLSGGTDSSLVCAIASKQLSKPLKTFSIGFKESKFDESKYAREVAQKLGTDHTEYRLSENEAVGLLESYLKHFDEPFADTSAIPTMLVSKLARKEVTVALTGDGGDELFQGYGAYEWANRLNTLPFKLFKSPIRAGMMLSGKSRLQRIAHILEPVKSDKIRSHVFSQEQYLFSEQEVQKHLLKDQNNFTPFLYNDNHFENKNLTPGEKQALFDLQFYLKDDLLVKVDRASMFSALECRSPLLDHRVVEYAFSLDQSLKVRSGKSKWLLKELLRKYLPHHLVDRQKWGFSVPLVKWLKTDLLYLIETYLSDEMITEMGLFQMSYIRQLKQEFFSGKEYLYNRLWVIIVVHKWLKENQ